jgi:hypothetical protein
MEKTTKALLGVLDTIGDIRPVDPREHAVNDCVLIRDAFINVADLVKDTVDGIVLFFVEHLHRRSVGGVRQAWMVEDDFVANSIADALPQDERSIDVVLSTLGRVIATRLTPSERRDAAGEAFFAAVEEHFERRCMEALLSAEMHESCIVPEMKAGVRALPRVVIDGVEYFVDTRLVELRRCDNPHERQPL